MRSSWSSCRSSSTRAAARRIWLACSCISLAAITLSTSASGELPSDEAIDSAGVPGVCSMASAPKLHQGQKAHSTTSAFEEFQLRGILRARERYGETAAQFTGASSAVDWDRVRKARGAPCNIKVSDVACRHFNLISCVRLEDHRCASIIGHVCQYPALRDAAVCGLGWTCGRMARLCVRQRSAHT